MSSRDLARIQDIEREVAKLQRAITTTKKRKSQKDADELSRVKSRIKQLQGQRRAILTDLAGGDHITRQKVWLANQIAFHRTIIKQYEDALDAIDDRVEHAAENLRTIESKLKACNSRKKSLESGRERSLELLLQNADRIQDITETFCECSDWSQEDLNSLKDITGQ